MTSESLNASLPPAHRWAATRKRVKAKLCLTWLKLRCFPSSGHLSEYTIIWWLRAEQTETLASQFVALTPHLGLDSAMYNQAPLTTLVCDELARRGGFLLVFDNLEEPEVLPNFLPRTGGTVLITARQRDWYGRAKTLPLDVMTEPEAVRLLNGRLDPDAMPPAELPKAMALAEELGCLPLALAQARGYIAATGETFAGYQALLVASRPIMLNEGHAHPDYPATVARTWDVSIRAAEQQCQAARLLLELLAFFAPDPLPRNVLAINPDALPEPLRDPQVRNHAIAALTRFSLVTAAQGSLTVHRLVQAVTRDGLVPDLIAPRVDCTFDLGMSWLSQIEDDKASCGWAIHMLTAFESALTDMVHALKKSPNPSTLIKLALVIGSGYPVLMLVELFMNRFKRDLTLVTEKLFEFFQLLMKVFDSEPADITVLRGCLALLFRARIELFDELIPPDHPHRMWLRKNYANLLDQLGQHAEAAELRAQT